ncbi:hypothetical protein [Rhodovulum sp. YEN HP10]|uniref:hypothetical protein n=1 Tax=Rhodovulum sp. HP10 TaxID=3387397 RepID=UPI0039E088D7
MTCKTAGYGLILALAATSAGAETLTFSPAAGSARSYRVELSVRSVEPDSRTVPLDDQRVSFLARIRAAERDGDSVGLTLKPLWLKTQLGDETMTTAGPIPDRVRAGFEAGFGARLDLATGALGEVVPLGDIEAAGPTLGGLREQFAAAFPPVPIELAEGWSTTVPRYGGVQDVTITVDHVTADRVFLRYEGEDYVARLAGLVVVDRDEGWVERAAITTDRRLVPGTDEDGSLRETVAIAPQGYPVTVQADTSLRPAEWRDMPERIAPPAPLASEAEVFPGGPGRLVEGPGGLLLEFDHRAAQWRNIGRFELSGLRLFAGDRVLDVPLTAEPPLTLPNWRAPEGVSQVSRSLLDATTLQDVSQDLEAATELRADLDWYPVAPFVMRLVPDGTGHAEASRDGARAVLAPAPEGYVLTLSGQQTDLFSWALPEGTGAQGMIFAADRGPDWLTPGESLARRIASLDYSAIRVLLRMDAPPEEMVVRVERYADTPAARREMRFLTEEGRRLDPDTAPERRPLFRGAPPPAPDEVMPEGLDTGALRLPLAPAQAAECTASLAPPATEGDAALVFVRRAAEEASLLELQTGDGQRRHFYGLGPRQVTLSCDATLAWTEAGLQLSPDRPWQIDPAALGIAEDMTLAEVMERLRFVDAEGVPLALSAPGGGALSPQDSIAQALFPDGTLRVAGTPAKILRAVRKPEPVTRSFRVSFPDLPVPERAAP